MILSLQVNLCQKLLFLHQLTHNMTTDCSLNYKFNTWKFQAQNMGENMLCTEIDFDIQNNLCTQHVLHMFCKNKSFWQRFTCSAICPGFFESTVYQFTIIIGGKNPYCLVHVIWDWCGWLKSLHCYTKPSFVTIVFIFKAWMCSISCWFFITHNYLYWFCVFAISKIAFCS